MAFCLVSVCIRQQLFLVFLYRRVFLSAWKSGDLRRQTENLEATRKTTLNIIKKTPQIIVEINENGPLYMCILEKHEKIMNYS